MPNSLVTPTWVMKEIGKRLVNNLRFANNVRRDYDEQYRVQGAKVGDTVKARLPQRYRVNKGQAISITAVEDRTVDITLTDQANVALEFSMASLTMEVDRYRERYLDPAVDALCNTVDYDGLDRMYKLIPKCVGTPGTTPGTTGTLPQDCYNVYAGAVTKLSEGAVPPPYVAIISPNMQQYLVAAGHLVTNPAGTISQQYKSGKFMGEALGVSEWFVDQNVRAHTVGQLGGTPLMNGTTLDGATTLVTNGWTSSAANRLKQGDVIQVAAVKEVNPQNYQSTGRLMDFVVTADTDSDGSGNATIPIYPAIQVAGNFATVNAVPLTSAAITTFSHASSYASKETPQGLIYHKDAFALVFADLEMPGNLWVAERIQNKALGIAIRFLKDYSIMTDQSPARVDCLYGWAAVRREMACRVAG